MTQQQALLNLFKEGKTLNLTSAFKLTGCHKLSTRVSDFKKLGYVFKVKLVKFITKYQTSGYYFDYSLNKSKTPKHLLK